MKNIKLFFLTVITTILFSGKLFAQEEYFTKMNLSDATFIIEDSIPGDNFVQTLPKSTTFDKNNHYFRFIGLDRSSNENLYTIDALTGNTLSHPLFPVLNPGDNICELYFDNISDTMYALHWNAVEDKEYLVWINPTTGSFTEIGSIPGVNYIALLEDGFDENNHQYLFVGMDSIGTTRLYTLDATTAKIIYSPLFNPANTGNFIEMQFDNAGGKLYSLHWDFTDSTEYIVSIDPATGFFKPVATLPSVKYVALGNYSFDEKNHLFIFDGLTTTDDRLFSIDVTNGNIVSDPIIPQLPPPQNLIQYQCDNSSGILYALHWGSIPSIADNIKPLNAFEPNVTISPNPFNDKTTVQFDKVYNSLTCFIYSANGQMVRKEDFSNKQQLSIEKEDLASGTYFLSLFITIVRYFFRTVKGVKVENKTAMA